MSSIFSKIIEGSIPCHKITEDERHFAFLDINPLAKGHALVVPKKEVDYLFDLENDDYLSLMQFVKKVSLAVEKAIFCKRVGLMVVGTEVPHAHVHVIPFASEGQMCVKNPKLTFTSKEFEEIASRISNFL